MTTILTLLSVSNGTLDSDIKRTVTECTILSKLKHPNIVEMSHWFETDKHIYIVMELAKDGTFRSKERDNK